MEILEWGPQLETGIPEIDKQHIRIVAMVNQMRTAIEKNDLDAVGQVIPEMVDYTLSHFAFEEALMEEAGYPFLKAHRRVHELFAQRIPEFQARYAAGENILEELHTMLARWLANHVSGEDQGYVSCIRAHLAGRQQAGGEGARLSEAVQSVAPRPAPAAPAEPAGAQHPGRASQAMQSAVQQTLARRRKLTLGAWLKRVLFHRF